MIISGNKPMNRVSDGIQRKILAHNKDLMTVELSFETGAVGAPHTHPHTQIGYVLSGKFTVTVGGETKECVAGDTYFCEPNELHGVVCTEKGRLLDIFTPRRDDFL